MGVVINGPGLALGIVSGKFCLVLGNGVTSKSTCVARAFWFCRPAVGSRHVNVKSVWLILRSRREGFVGCEAV